MATAKKAATKKATAKKTTAKKTATKATAKKTAAKKATAKKSTAKKAIAKKATATGSASATSSTGAREGLIVTSKLREKLRSQDVRMSSDLVSALNDEVHALLDKAVDRAKGNKRGTVRPTDL